MADNFQGDNANLIASINALLELDASGDLAPHGIGGHARFLLETSASRLQALSHAAGQEVVFYAPKGLVETCRAIASVQDLHRVVLATKASDSHPVALCIAPAVARIEAAPPTTSAEVGRNSDRYLWLKENAPDAHMWSDESIDAAMAASSGRQGENE